MPFLIAIGMIYILWRLTRNGHAGELAGRVRILEARVRMLEEQMDWHPTDRRRSGTPRIFQSD
jgi:hypothetical protein